MRALRGGHRLAFATTNAQPTFSVSVRVGCVWDLKDDMANSGSKQELRYDSRRSKELMRSW